MIYRTSIEKRDDGRYTVRILSSLDDSDSLRSLSENSLRIVCESFGKARESLEEHGDREIPKMINLDEEEESRIRECFREKIKP